MQKIKRGQKAQAGVIATILLILIVLAAIIVVWNVVNRVVKKGAEGIGTEALTVNLEISEAKLFVTGGAEVKVHRGSGKGEITELKFVFEKADGESEIIARKAPDYEMPDELETKIYYFTASEINEKIEKVSIAPMFGSSTGVQVSEPETEIKKDNSGERILDAPAGLVSWWKFDGNFNDAMGNNNGVQGTGSDANTNNNVLNLDGIDDYINAGNGASLNIVNEITISAWIYPETTSIGTVVAKNGPYYLGYGNSQIGVSQKVGGGILSGGWTWISGNTVIPLNTWSHIAASYNGSTIKVYLNGKEDGLTSKSGSMPIISDSVKIGWGSPGLDQYFNGTIDDVMIFNKALSSDEIKAIYNNQKK